MNQQDIARALGLVTGLCLRFEGVYLRPYICPAGVPTISAGITRYLDGRAVALTDPPISKETAMRLLEQHLARNYVPGTLNLCQGIDTPERLAAISDLAFNIGLGALRSSTLRRKVNAGDWDGAKRELMRWTRGGGRVLRGLVLRRQAEAALL